MRNGYREKAIACARLHHLESYLFLWEWKRRNPLILMLYASVKVIVLVWKNMENTGFILDVLSALTRTPKQLVWSGKRHRKKDTVHLGWESCQHVGNMSDRQPNVGTFGRHIPVVATQNQSRHSIFVSGIADIHPICILVPELHTKNSSVTFGRNIWLISVQPRYFPAPLNA